MGKKYSEMTEEEKEKKREYCRKWRLNNREKAKEYRKLSYQRNKSRDIAKNKEWALKNPEKKKEYDRRSKQRNKEKNKEWAKKYRLENREKVNETRRKFREKNREKIKKWYKLWANNNAEKLREKKKQWADNNAEKLRELSKKKREILLGTYVKSRLRRNGFPKEAITPELIEVQRLIIKTKRLTKNKLKEN